MLTRISRKPKVKLGPQHQGHRMPLKRFEFAEAEEGYLFELARGYVVVSEVPSYSHAKQIEVARDRISYYKLAHPGRIDSVLGSMDCKLVISSWESERHPDIAVYLVRPKGPRNRMLWRSWIPELIIEVVSPTSSDRDYVEKRDEYWSLGVKEHWIVDAAMQKVTLLRRGRSDWCKKELGKDRVCETKLLPDFKLPCQAIFDAAAAAEVE